MSQWASGVQDQFSSVYAALVTAVTTAAGVNYYTYAEQVGNGSGGYVALPEGRSGSGAAFGAVEMNNALITIPAAGLLVWMRLRSPQDDGALYEFNGAGSTGPSGWTPEPANEVLAGPTSGADATPTFRQMVLDDIPAAGSANQLQYHGVTHHPAASSQFTVDPATGLLYVNGPLQLDGTGEVNFTTPAGGTVGTKILVPVFSPSAFGQVVALGLPAAAADTTRAITLFDARTVAHQPTIMVLSRDENQAVGLSWDGLNTLARLKCSQDIALSVGALISSIDVLTVSQGFTSVTIQAAADVAVALVVAGHSVTQSADLFQIATSGGTVLLSVPNSGTVSLHSHLITNVLDPVSAQDVATKLYTDTAIATAVAAVETKTECTSATIAALAASTYSNGSSGVGATITLTVAAVLVIDGYTPALNDRILIKNQASALENGIYRLSTVGVLGVTQAVLTRTTDFDQNADGIDGALVYILSGTTNGNTLWVCTTTGVVVVGTTAINWSQFTGSTYTADETSIHLSGTTFSIKSTWTGQSTITTVGTLTSGATGAGFTLDLATSTISGTLPIANLPGATLKWTKISKTHTNFDAAATTNDIEIYSLAAGEVFHSARMQPTTGFSGPGIVAYTISLGTSTGHANFIGVDSVIVAGGVFFHDDGTHTVNAGGGTALPRTYSMTGATSVRAYAQSTGANLNAATAGAVDFEVLTSTPP